MRASRQVEALEDLLGHLGVFDGREQAHAGSAARTAKCVDFKYPLE
jgi:hypothetical protein